jgi:hypothetical protein
MSTNFHWAVVASVLPTGETVRPDTDAPEVHIGKRGGRSFCWAQDPAAVARIAALRPRAKLIEDDYGRRYTWAQFQEAIADLESDLSLIGKWFA